MGNLIVCISAIGYECAARLMVCRSELQATTAAAAAPAGGAQAQAEAGRPAEPAKGRPAPEKPSKAYEGDEPTSGVSRCCTSAFGGFAILASTPFLRAITGHTLLVTFLVSGVWYERAAAVAAAFATSEEQYDFFATLNFVVGSLTLVVQVRIIAHAVARLPRA